MIRILLVLFFAVVGFVATAVLSYFLITKLSSNQHDRSVEAAMSSIFFFGPLGAIGAAILAFLRTGH
ncbi:MAG: hypothetical protein HUU04_10165 [Verrucomicrobiae bacterium]|nr:hypothetical protein [Verrucomicrobiae bacterium]